MSRVLETIVLFGVLLASAGIAITATWLNWLPCYATICPEEYFAFETKLHVAIYYGLLTVTTAVLLLRAHVPFVRYLLGSHIVGTLPLVGRRVTLGGLLTCVWVVGVTGATTVLWLPEHLDFWGARTDPLDWLAAKIQLTITGVTGHYADILLGLLLIPVSRNSIVGRAFHLHQSTLLFTHKMVSYLFSLSTMAHGGAYLSYALDGSSDGDLAREEAFATGNPAMTLSESKQRSAWFTKTTYTGLGALLPLVIILLTSLPWVRRNHYNIFYYNHVAMGIIIMVAAIIHASTDLYLLAPGLSLWIADRVQRLWFGEAKGKVVVASVDNAGNDWVRISMPAFGNMSDSDPEKSVVVGDPLLYYYISCPAISKIQNHPFTAAIPRTSNKGPVFLLQPTLGKPQKRLDKEWTWKMSKFVPRETDIVPLDMSVQGPYTVNDDGYKEASHIVCIVGGTGVTGACSLVHWWLENRSQDSLLTVIWTIRHGEASNVQEWHDLRNAASVNANLDVFVHESFANGRLEPLSCLDNCLARDHVSSTSAGRAWIYASGPEGLLRATESACIKAQQDIRRAQKENGNRRWAVQDISWYIARWEV